MSIEDIPRWWPGLISGGGLFSFGGVSWIRINDDDPILVRDAELNIRSKNFGRGDFIAYGPGDEGWGVIRGGDHDTARIVKARRV